MALRIKPSTACLDRNRTNQASKSGDTFVSHQTSWTFWGPTNRGSSSFMTIRITHSSNKIKKSSCFAFLRLQRWKFGTVLEPTILIEQQKKLKQKKYQTIIVALAVTHKSSKIDLSGNWCLTHLFNCRSKKYQNVATYSGDFYSIRLVKKIFCCDPSWWQQLFYAAFLTLSRSQFLMNGVQ